MIIVIDGPSGTGKSTVAKELARRLGFTFFDTGAMYRSFAWFVLQKNIDPSDRQQVIPLVDFFQYEISTSPQGERRYFVNKHDVTGVIREVPISQIASQIAKYPEVRECMVKIQRQFALRTHAVFEGRDMGTVVFPHADVKIFLTARVDVRAQRRFRELLMKFPDLAESLEIEQVQKELQERDAADQNRTISPLKQASDAVLLDTSDLSIPEVVQKILPLCSQRTRLYPRKRFIYGTICWLVRIYFKWFFGLKVYGLEHYRRGGGILAANHSSNFDPNVISISCPEEVHFLAKESLFSIPLLGRLIRILNSHPVSRTGNDVHTFKTILHLLQQGNKVILFPEGKRSFDGQLQPIERGLSFLMQKARTTIFPIYVHGTFEAWPRTKKLPRPFGKIAVVFGSPIEWEDFAGLSKQEAEAQITERMAESLRGLKDWIESGCVGSLPKD